MLWTLAGAEKIRRRAIGGGGNGSDFGDFNLGNVTGIRVIFPPRADTRDFDMGVGRDDATRSGRRHDCDSPQAYRGKLIRQ